MRLRPSFTEKGSRVAVADVVVAPVFHVADGGPLHHLEHYHQPLGSALGVGLHVDKPGKINQLTDILLDELAIKGAADARRQLRQDACDRNAASPFHANVGHQFVTGR